MGGAEDVPTPTLKSEKARSLLACEALVSATLRATGRRSVASGTNKVIMGARSAIGGKEPSFACVRDLELSNGRAKTSFLVSPSIASDGESGRSDASTGVDEGRQNTVLVKGFSDSTRDKMGVQLGGITDFSESAAEISVFSDEGETRDS